MMCNSQMGLWWADGRTLPVFSTAARASKRLLHKGFPLNYYWPTLKHVSKSRLFLVNVWQQNFWNCFLLQSKLVIVSIMGGLCRLITKGYRDRWMGWLWVMSYDSIKFFIWKQCKLVGTLTILMIEINQRLKNSQIKLFHKVWLYCHEKEINETWALPRDYSGTYFNEKWLRHGDH